MKRPNILFALADDASHFGIYGHAFVSTPNIDKLAQEGILFTNAFTANPKCAPSRASILTGMHPWQLEEACNHYGIFPAKFPVYPDLLESAGYWTGYTGKGWAPGDFIRGGFKRNPAGNAYNSVSLIPPENSLISRCDYHGNFLDFLSKKPSESPFCFWYGCLEPHRHYNPGEGIRAGKKLEDIDYIPSYLPDNDVVRSDFLDYASEIDWFDLQLGKIIDTLKETGEYENTLIIVTSDNGCPFPRIKGQMYEQDFHLPLVACWKNMTEGGRVIDDHVNFIDFAPTFLEAARVTVPETVTGRSFIDIFKTNKSGVVDKERCVSFFGREKHDVGRKGDVGYPVRCLRNDKYLYIRNFEPERWPAGDPETWFPNCDGSPTKKEVLRLYAEGDVVSFQYCFGRRDLEELYDITADPECMKNLACEDEYLEIRQSMWKQLENELIRTNDPRISGNGDIFDRYEYTGPDDTSFKAYEEGRFKIQPW
ncbi:MAG: sulfatase family protein [Saccharofermentanales bacterium]